MKTPSASPASSTRWASRRSSARVRRSRAEIALSLGVLGLGAGAAWVTARLPGEGGYAGIGPNFFPAVVSGGLLLMGVGISNLLEIKKIRVGNMLPALLVAPLIVWILGLFG